MFKGKRARIEGLWQEFLKLNPNNVELRIIIRSVEPLMERAWDQLLILKPAENDLCYIFVFLRRKTAKEFLLRVSEVHYSLFLRARYEEMRKKNPSLQNNDTTFGAADMNILKEIEKTISDPLKRKILKEMISLSD